MKKILCIALALIMLLSLCACGSETKDKGLTITEGVLTVVTSPDYAPYEFYALDSEGTPSLAGFDMALAKYIADYLGLELEVIPMSFNGICGEMSTGVADLAIAGLSPDPDREDAMDFSDIYYAGKQAFVTVSDKADMFTDLDSTNKAGLQIGAQSGAIQMDLAQTYSPDADIISLTKATDIIAELVSGSLDGAYVEWDVAVAYQANYPELHIVCEVPYEADGNVVGVMKGNEDLLAKVNEAISKCVEDGSFAQFVAEALELAAGDTASYVDGDIIPDSED